MLIFGIQVNGLTFFRGGYRRSGSNDAEGIYLANCSGQY